MEAAIERLEKAIFAAVVFPFAFVLRFPNLSFLLFAVPGMLVGWYGPRDLAIALWVGAVVVTSVALGASLERIRQRQK